MPSTSTTTDIQLTETDMAASDTKGPLDAQVPISKDDEVHYLTGFVRASVLGCLIMVVFLLMLDSSIVVTAIPRMTTQFHSLQDVGWYGSAFLFSNCALQPLAGKVYAQFSYKYTFLSFFAVFEFGSLLCAVSVSSTMFIIGRAVAGMGCSGLINGALSIISVTIPPERRPLYMGLLMSMSQFGVLFGPLIGGALTQYATWRWCFYINLPCGALAALGLLFAPIPRGPGKSESSKVDIRAVLASLDLVGFVLFAPAIIQFLLALQWGGTKYAWDSATIIGLFCGGGATSCVFVIWEYFRGTRAMIPLHMIRQRIFWSSCLTVFFTFAVFMCVNYYLPIYFQAVRGATPTMSGVDMLPSIISQMIFSGVGGTLVTKLGYYLPFSIICGVLMAVSSGLISTFTPHTSTGIWIGYQIIGGVARGLGIQMPIVAVQNLLPKEQTSIAMSLVVFSQTFGGALFLSFAQTVFNTGLSDALAKYAPTVSAAEIQAAGATGFRDVVSSAVLPAVLRAYNEAVTHVFYLASGAAVAATVVCLGMGWKNIKKPKQTENAEQVSDAASA